MSVNIRRYAKTALDKTNDKPKAAIDWLCKEAKKVPELNSALLVFGAKQIVRDFFSSQRISAMSMATCRVAANLNNSNVSNRVAARLARIAFWDAYTLFGMTPIKDANRKMLLDSAENRESQASGEIRLAKFERAVAAALKGSKTVKDCMTVDQLEKMASRYRSAK